MSRVHEVKAWPEPFAAVRAGSKTFEFRRNDRDYRPGDFIVLREWDPVTEVYSGRRVVRRLGYVLTAGFGLPPGCAVLSLMTTAPTAEGDS